MKLKFWLGFGENAIFSRKDIPILLVVPRDGNVEQHLTNASFVEADDLASARVKLISKIDEWYEHALHMEKLEKLCRDKAAGIPIPSSPSYPQSPRAKPVILDENSLSIGPDKSSGFSMPDIPLSPPSEGLLDLGELK